MEGERQFRHVRINLSWESNVVISFFVYMPIFCFRFYQCGDCGFTLDDVMWV